LWKCPNCETVNDADICIVCGEKRPPVQANGGYNAVSQTPSTQQTAPSAPAAAPPRSNLWSILLPIIITSLFIIVFVVSFLIFDTKFNRREDAGKDIAGSNVTLNIEKKEKQPDEKAEERPATVIETAVLNGKAAKSDSGREYNSVQLTNVPEYIKETIQPLYYEIKRENLTAQKYSDGRTVYADNYGHICWIQYPAGLNGNSYERQYYFDRSNGELIFAFIFYGKTEQRLYFYKNSLIRYIDTNGFTTDNPTDRGVLAVSQDAIREAYSK